MTRCPVSPADLIVHVQDRVGVISLNRPDRMNVFTAAGRSALIASLRALDSDAEVDAIVLRGVDASAFSSGSNPDEVLVGALNDLAGWQRHLQAMYQAMRDLEKPSVAAVDGICVGCGMDMALCADWRLATPRSIWGQPEVKAGLASMVGPYLIGLHAGRTHSVQLALSGEPISGRRAYEIGLVTQLVEPDELYVRAFERAKALGALPRIAVTLTKRRFRETTQAEFDAVCRASIDAQKHFSGRG